MTTTNPTTRSTHEYHDAAGARALARSAFDHARDLEAAGDIDHAAEHYARAESFLSAAEKMGDCEITAIPVEDCRVCDHPADAEPDCDYARGFRGPVAVDVKCEIPTNRMYVRPLRSAPGTPWELV